MRFGKGFDWPPPRDLDWLSRQDIETLEPGLFFFARDKLAASLVAGKFRLLSAFAAHAASRGLQVAVIDAACDGQDLLQGPHHLRIFMQDRPFFADNAFHCVPGYLRGYWYFDEVATRNNSSHRLRPFDPRPINADFSERFLDRLRGQFVAANLSKFPQADRGSVPLIQGCLAVFAQDFKPPRHHRHYMTVPAMIDAAIAARGGRPLYIKPHPNNSPEELIQLRKYHDPSGGVYLTGASIHDLLAVADCAITLTSAVGFEGFLHKTPLVLGGQTDFHHNAITLTDPARMHDAITAALMRDWPHAKYLSWFLRQNYLADHPNSLPDLLDRVHRKGFAFADAAGRGFY